MKQRKIEAFYCDFCGNKRTFSKGSMTRHEKFCGSNPANYHKCLDVKGGHCANLEIVKTEVEFAYYGDRDHIITTTVNKYRCKALDKMLHSFKAVGKRLLIRYPDQFEGSEIMPAKCEFAKEIEF